jgi:hypothetical protein
LGTYSVKRLTGINYSSLAFLKIALADVLMIAFFLGFRLIVTSVPLALLVGGLGILVYIGALLLFGGIGKADVQVLRQISISMGEPRLLRRAANFLEKLAR